MLTVVFGYHLPYIVDENGVIHGLAITSYDFKPSQLTEPVSSLRIFTRPEGTSFISGIKLFKVTNVELCHPELWHAGKIETISPHGNTSGGSLSHICPVGSQYVGTFRLDRSV